jgi:hypothetical protein
MRIPLLALGAGGALAGLVWGPTVRLRDDHVDVGATQQELLEELREHFADSPEQVLAADGRHIVRRFAGRAGPFPYRTVELVTFEDDAITFEHLAGPFRHCHERFQLSTTPSGTRLTHTGHFVLRGGLWTALLALGPVKSAFEAHVHHHLRELPARLSDPGAGDVTG